LVKTPHATNLRPEVCVASESHSQKISVISELFIAV
jgi:hypothetical protein